MIMKLLISKIIFLFFIGFMYLFNIFSCASIQSPSGGPRDDTPPVLLKSIPKSGSTNFDKGVIELYFSEHILEKSIFDAITLIPNISNSLNIKYKGQELIINLPDSLLKNQTYILSINRKLKDENGVSLAETIQLAFSTGNKIDNSKIIGRLFSKNQASACLWKVNDSLDFMNFFQRIPDYIADASEDGDFSFNYLSSGTYKLIGINSHDLGKTLVPNYSIYGTPMENIIKIDSVNTIIDKVKVLIPDKSKYAKIINGKWIDNMWGVINFDMPISNFRDSISVKIDFEGRLIKAELFVDKKEKNILNFYSQDFIKSGAKTLIHITPKNGVTTAIIDSSVLSIKTKSNLDTLYLEINNLEKINNLDIEINDIVPFDIEFSKLIFAENIDTAIALKKDSVDINFNLKKLSPINYQVVPTQNWEPETNYSLIITKDKFKLPGIKGIKDSIMIINIQTSAFKKFGSFVGNILEPYPTPIIAKLASLEKEYYFQDAIVNSKSSFKIDKIPEGIYSLMFYHDRDKNNNYSYGYLSPYEPAEWFEIIPDTISIRSNWDMEITNIKLNGS